MCKSAGHMVEATIADHKTPHKGVAELFWNPRNLQSLCATHHSSSKARQEARGHTIGADASGLPLDANHHWNK